MAGAAALLRAVDPALSNGVVVARLAASADAAGTSDQTGNGRLNLARALFDESTTPVVPAGAPGGGPFVGPYVAAARNWHLPFAGTGTGSVKLTPSSGTINAPTTCGGTGTNATSQTITSDCSPNITTSANGATITFEAIPASGSAFADWSAASLVTEDCVPTKNPCTGTFTGNGSITVTFNAKANQAITFGALAGKTYGDAPFTVSATASSGLAVSFSSTTTGVCTVAGSTVTIVAAGTCTIVANQAGNANYNAAPQVTQSFTVGKKAASVTPNAASKTYGDADPAFTGTLSGFLVADGVTATYNRTAGETVGGSPYAISATLAPAGVLGNYTITYNTANFAIGQAAPVCSVSAYSVTYDSFSHTATGACLGVLGETLAGLDLSGTTHTAAGDYTGDAWAFTDVTGNYSNTSGTVDDAIGQAAPVCSVSAYSVTYDSFSHTATGACLGVLGETLAGLDLSGTTHTAAGDYTGDAWAFTDVTGNYSNTSGTVDDAIGQAAPVCSVSAYSVTYDSFSHTATGACLGVLGETLAGLDLSGTTHTAAGDYTGDAWAFTDVTGNYSNTSGTVDDAIGQAAPVCSVSAYSVTYDSFSHTATGACLGVLGETLAGLDLSGTTHTAAGDYTGDAWAFTDVTGNYSNTSGTVDDAIGQAAPVCSVSAYSVTYDSFSHTATGACLGVLGETLAGLDLSGTTHTAAGDYTGDAWAFTDVTGNYSNTSGTVDDAIGQAAPVCSVSAYSVTYDSFSHTATGACLGVLGETLAGLDLSGTTHTAAGDYTGDAWAFTDVTGNYSNTSGTVDDVIGQAAPVCSVSAYSVTYDSFSHTATGACLGVLGEPLAGLDLSGTTHTAAGDYTGDAWAFTDVTGNYSKTSGTVDDAIGQAAPVCSVSAYSVTYDSFSHTATGACLGVLGETLAGLDLSGTTHTAAGDYTGDAWAFTDVTGNYSNTSGTVDDAIGQAAPVCSVSAYSVTYDSFSHTATGACLGVLGETLAGLDLSGTTHTAAGDYTGDAWAFTDVTGNYSNTSGTVDDAIGQAARSARSAPTR